MRFVLSPERFSCASGSSRICHNRDSYEFRDLFSIDLRILKLLYLQFLKSFDLFLLLCGAKNSRGESVSCV